MKKAFVFGTSSFAECVMYHLEKFTKYKIGGWLLDPEYITKNSHLGYNIYDFSKYQPERGDSIYIAINYHKLNSLRAAKLAEAKAKGWRPITYISPESMVHTDLIGEHCFIFEKNNIQPYVFLGDNCVLWAANHIGHHSRIDSNQFITSGVTISGHCVIEPNCFFGVSSWIGNGVTVGHHSWLSPNTGSIKNIEPYSLLLPSKPELHKKNTGEFFDL